VTSRTDTEAIAHARATPVIDEIDHRRIKLRRQGRELVGPCPVCGDGGKGLRSDRFAVHVVKNTWLCRKCPAGGSIIDLVMHLDGVSFEEALAILTERKRYVSAPRPAAVSSDDSHRRAIRLWDEAVPIGGTIAARYLTETRKLVLPQDISPRVLRFHPACPFGEGARHPCLVALYRDIATDAPRAIMRTALTPDARKIDRMAIGAVGGAAIKLSDDADVTMALVIGEGLETTLAGMVFGFAPAWALGSAGAIAKFPVLSGIEALTVLAETEDGGANERAIQDCFDRWSAAKREVFRATSLIGGDLNDALTMAVPSDDADPSAFQRERA
jgi:putative DNA primase/helicase